MIRKRRPTIIDVAREAGVSKSTVSLVLQNSSSVREETRRQVREAMSKIGYVYNRAAATLRASNAGLVGLVINDLRNPFYTEFAVSVQMALAERGYATVIANTDEDPDLQEQVVASMVEHGVSAFLITSAFGDVRASFDAIARAHIPAMQALRHVEDRMDLFPFAAPQYQQGGKLACQHLLDAGARRIAFVGGYDGRLVTEQRKAGYLEALEGADMEPLLLPGRPIRAFGKEAAKRLEAEHPDIDAAFCFNDLVALGMLSGLLELGRKVGSDFLLVGFDDIEDVSQTFPSLTSVRCDIAGFGQKVAEVLLKWLEEGVMPPLETRTPVSLSIRQSSGTILA